MDCILLTWRNEVPYFDISDPIAFVLPEDTPDEVVRGVVASMYQRSTSSLGDLRAWASYGYAGALAGEPVANGPGLRTEDGPNGSERITYTQTGDKVTLVARRVTDFEVEQDREEDIEVVRWTEPGGERVEVRREPRHVDLYRTHVRDK